MSGTFAVRGKHNQPFVMIKANRSRRRVDLSAGGHNVRTYKRQKMPAITKSPQTQPHLPLPFTCTPSQSALSDSVPRARGRREHAGGEEVLLLLARGARVVLRREGALLELTNTPSLGAHH